MTNYIPNKNFTDEQLTATLKKGKNIIVSAGAGSGKTTVLKERVLRILLDDYFEDGRKVHINNLIILTFTKNAAEEMKIRIRKIISEHEELKNEAEILESAYITTFDSYASSLVKKYNYLLNIDKSFTIIDSSLLSLTIDKFLDIIFENNYESQDENFLDFIKCFTIKDDTTIRTYIKEMYNGLLNKLNRDNYLDNYIKEYYNDKFINKIFERYESDYLKKRDDIADLYELLSDETINPEKLELNNKAINDFLCATSYDEILYSLNFNLQAAYKNVYTDAGKDLKKQIDKIKADMKKEIYLSKNELIDKYKSTEKYVSVIISIIKKLDLMVNKYKEDNNAYDFTDIALKAIELVKIHEEVRSEIKTNTYEIMIDEYQDTNDIQEVFISYIENKNVYMVGDIKQSIYRFRNANPYIFKNKYDLYKDDETGYKIDLNKNFRSRHEVVDNINSIFENIMHNDIGGANYKLEHEMVFGNTTFDKIKDDNQDYNMQVLEYEECDKYNNDEIEAFIIAKDILDKLKKKDQVFDNKGLRDVTYKDFCILVDKGKNFDLIKKVLEYHKIPVSIDKDISIKEDDEIFILKNIVNLIISIKNNNFDINFIHYYMSIARSYVYKINDQELFDIVINKSFKETSLYQICFELSKMIDALSNKEILNLIVEKFDIINKLILVGDIEARLSRLEYFINNASNLNNFGMNIYELSNYFDEVIKSSSDITMTRSKSASNSVKVMTIHGSKGLEFNYVYMPFLGSDFTKNANVKNFSFDSSLGFIIPFYDNGVGSTFLRTLANTKEKIENLSERIRLLYVALTRPIEKFTLIINHKEEETDILNYSSLSNTKSYQDIINLLRNKISDKIEKVNLETLNLTDEYKNILNYNYKDLIAKCNEKVITKEIVIESKILKNKHFSKALNKVIDRSLKDLLDFGTMMHYCFEVYNFQNDNLDKLDIKDEYKESIKNFLKHEEVKNIKYAKTYKEHEILFTKKGSTYHGFIDLLVEYDDYYDIIDYKLSNISSEEYVIQLNGYKDYIENKFNKPCNIYLYSIKKDCFKKLN